MSLSPGSRPAVSVIMPVRNEERHLRSAVRQVLDQDYPSEVEVVLAVGPSRDNTEAVAARIASEEQAVSVVSNPSGQTPSALNAAIEASRHPIVARVDGHAMLSPRYLRIAVDALAETGADNVGGVMAAEGVTAFEQAVARAMTSRLGVGNARFHTGGESGPADTVYLGVFRRGALERVGGYDPSFLRAQDWEMNLRIRKTGGLVWFTPDLQVCYRPRSTLRALAKQYVDYGRWRRVVARQYPGTVSVRYLAPPMAVLTMFAGIALAIFGFRPGLVAPGAYLLCLLVGAAWTGRGLSPRAWVWLPLVYATMHCCWGAGFLTSPRDLRRGSSKTNSSAGQAPEPEKSEPPRDQSSR